MKLSNETVKRVVVSTATIGDRLRLCGVRPYYEYVNGTRTDTIVGLRLHRDLLRSAW